ncbi:hypothetical protein D3C73_883730 [compost metagenome]
MAHRVINIFEVIDIQEKECRLPARMLFNKIRQLLGQRQPVRQTAENVVIGQQPVFFFTGLQQLLILHNLLILLHKLILQGGQLLIGGLQLLVAHLQPALVTLAARHVHH